MEIPIFKIRASKAGAIMTEPQGKTNLEKLEDAQKKILLKKAQFDKLKDKECITALKLIKEVIHIEQHKIPEFVKFKDVIELSETCKTYLSEWIIEKKYGREKEFTSKQTEKGKQTEQDGFQVIQDVLYPDVFISKSKTHYEDDFKTGDLDAIVNKTVLDNKSSFTLWSFPFTEKEAKNKDYIAQMKVYIDLAKADNAKLCYTLNNTPFEIVDKELRNWCYANKCEFDEMPEGIAYSIIKNHVYTFDGLKIYSFVLGTLDISDFIEIPKEKRLKHFAVEKDDDFIQRLHLRVIECRTWIAENWDKF